MHFFFARLGWWVGLVVDVEAGGSGSIYTIQADAAVTGGGSDGWRRRGVFVSRLLKIHLKL